MKVHEIRDSYIEYFRGKGHTIVPSSPLIPADDPTLLFTTAGMVQFKPMFAGTVELTYTRAASIQKCLRTSDLERVGRTQRHCTFFEMLGNFSFGDYFKNEAIAFAWDYSVNVLKFNPEKLWVSVYQDDDEAFDIWNKEIGVPAERIVRLGKADNFWGPAGDSGACGPCSELYIDKGAEFGCGSPDCKPGCDCERFMEYWNLVFNQFNQDINGVLHPLPRTGIDTGMGLERLATIVQNVPTIYETNELKSLCEFICRELNVKYEGEQKIAVNVLVEHSRSLCFAMADGAYPSNEGRGYVLRRILRRALRFGRQLGIREPFVYRMVDPIVEIYGKYYPELVSAAPNLRNVLEGEEKRFLETLEHGMTRLEEIMVAAKKNGTISGRDAFLLYDTFGFPVEMTIEMAGENGLEVDRAGFDEEMNRQRERGKQSWKGADQNLEQMLAALGKKAGVTKFTGYETMSGKGRVLCLGANGSLCEGLNAGEDGYIVLDTTPFYGESGGQVGDTGVLSAAGVEFEVYSTIRVNKTFVHAGRVKTGRIAEGAELVAQVDVERRNLIRANHTATHLLQAALQKVLGSHVRQAGSLVEPERLRFDFSHFEAMTADQIRETENLVNAAIWQNHAVQTGEMDLQTALKSGAMAEFGEKYESTVRVVSVEGVSRELCGGTHVDNTGSIGVFKILKESSPGAGMRRIEGLTLKGLLDRYYTLDTIVSGLTDELNGTENDIAKKVIDLQQKNSQLQKELEEMKRSMLAGGVDDIINAGEQVGSTLVISQRLDGSSIDDLKSLADLVRSRKNDSALVLGAVTGDKVVLLCAATPVAVKRGFHAGNIIKEIAKMVGGGGGGRPDMAQAGGKDASALDAALTKGNELVKGMLK